MTGFCGRYFTLLSKLHMLSKAEGSGEKQINTIHTSIDTVVTIVTQVEGRDSLRGAGSIAMKFHGNVHGELRVNFLALFASKPDIFICGALELFQVVGANVRLNFGIPRHCLVPAHLCCTITYVCNVWVHL